MLRFHVRLTGLVLMLCLLGCSTTEKQVAGYLEDLAANDIGSPNWQVAVDGLAALGRPAARQLIAHLAPAYYVGQNYREHRDEIAKIRTGCAKVLGLIRYRGAAATILAHITAVYQKSERIAGIWSLGELGFDQAALDAVKLQLDDADPEIRLYAAVALVKMDDYSATKEITSQLQEAGSLGDIALEQLASTNYFGIPFLVEQAQHKGPRQAQIRTVLTTVKNQLITQLEDEDPDLRRFSARALGRVNDVSVRAPLEAKLQDSSNLVCFNAAASLAEMGQDSGIGFLFDALENEDPILRVNAVKFLTEVQRSTGAVESRLITALSDDDPLARAGAAQVLGQARVKTAVAALEKTVRDKEATVRWNAIISLGRIASDTSRALLEELSHDADKTVSYYALWALNQLGNG